MGSAPAADTAIEEQYRRFTRRRVSLLLGGSALLVVLAVGALWVGSADLSLEEVLRALAARVTPSVTVPVFDYSIVWELRVPRIVMGIIAGAGLAVSGAQMQGITKNPLVSPFTVGISSAAAFGASVAIMFGFGFAGLGTLAIVGSAFAASMACAVLVFGLANMRGASPETLILAGIALSYLFSALTSMVHFFASQEDLMAMVRWTFGSLTGVGWYEILVVSVVFAISFPVLLKYSWDINSMAAGGDEMARALGVDTKRVRVVSLMLSALITATIISFTGIIGFVCLVSPHIARYLIGGDHRFLLPASCLVGAIVMIAADVVGRTVLSPIVLPIGIVTSLVGVPLFLYLLLTRKHDQWGGS